MTKHATANDLGIFIIQAKVALFSSESPFSKVLFTFFILGRSFVPSLGYRIAEVICYFRPNYGTINDRTGGAWMSRSTTPVQVPTFRSDVTFLRPELGR